MANSSILFDVLANILVKKSEEIYQKHINDEQLWKSYTSYMTLRYLTMSTSDAVRNVVLENYVHLERMPAKIQYHWLMHNIPKQSSSWIKYIK